MLQGETILAGGPARCDVCGVVLEFKVLHSAAGFYIGTCCMCGPYTRESGYYPTRDLAEAAFKLGSEVYAR